MFSHFPSSSCDYRLHSLFPRTVWDWNRLPQDVVQTGTVKAFLRALLTVYKLLECSLHLLCTEPLLLICFFLFRTLLFACTVSCQHLVEWRSGHSLHCVCAPPTMYQSLQLIEVCTLTSRREEGFWALRAASTPKNLGPHTYLFL